jgi:hypothetical protein
MAQFVSEEDRKKWLETIGSIKAGVLAGGTPVAAHELTKLSRALGAQLPMAYVEFLRQHGAAEWGHAEPAGRGERPAKLRQILSPEEALKKSREMWCLQLPVDMFVFGLDNRGNMLCFQQCKMAGADTPVFLWSAKSGRIVRVADSFNELLAVQVAGAKAGAAA